jgi:hypothetical protein
MPKAVKIKVAGISETMTLTPGGRPKKGLRDSQVRTLRLLAEQVRGEEVPLTKHEIVTQANVAESDLTKYVGSDDPAVRKRNDERWFPSLLTLGYVKRVKQKGDKDAKVDARIKGGYVITPAGRKALEKFDKQSAK